MIDPTTIRMFKPLIALAPFDSCNPISRSDANDETGRPVSTKTHTFSPKDVAEKVEANSMPTGVLGINELFYQYFRKIRSN